LKEPTNRSHPIIGSKSRKRSGAGGVGKEDEEEGSKRRRMIGVRGGPVEGEREEGGG